MHASYVDYCCQPLSSSSSSSSKRASAAGAAVVTVSARRYLYELSRGARSIGSAINYRTAGGRRCAVPASLPPRSVRRRDGRVRGVFTFRRRRCLAVLSCLSLSSGFTAARSYCLLPPLTLYAAHNRLFTGHCHWPVWQMKCWSLNCCARF